MLKIALAAGLLAAPALLAAQPPEQVGNGMGTEADAAAHSNGMSSTDMHHAPGHRSTMGKSMAHHRGHTTRGASPSNDTATTPNSSNSKSGPLNSNPH